MLSISDNTLFATCDQEATWDLANLRKKLHGSISQALGDTALEPVELLAIPLYTLNQEVDVTAISVPLFDEIGVRDWPLVLNFSNFEITKEVGSGNLFVTAVVKPDTLSRQSIENQFLRDVDLLHYPPVKLFKVSKTGAFKAGQIYNGLTSWPGNFKTRIFPLEAQVRNLLLLTEFQAFRLKLAGIGRHANNLQWHDLSLIPRGSRLRDHLSMFKNWGRDGRSTKTQLSEGEMTEKQAQTKLGRMCPWLLQFQFEDEWSDLNPQKVEIVATDGVISRSQKILSLVDKDRTARLLHDSVNYHLQADPEGTSEYLKELLQVTEEEHANLNVQDALETLGTLLQRRKQPSGSTRQPRYSEFGLDHQGRVQRRSMTAGVPFGAGALQTGLHFARANGNRVAAGPGLVSGCAGYRPVHEEDEEESDVESLAWDDGLNMYIKDQWIEPTGTKPKTTPATPAKELSAVTVDTPKLRLRQSPVLWTPRFIEESAGRGGVTFNDPRAVWANCIQLPCPSNVECWQQLSQIFGRYKLETGTDFRKFVENTDEFQKVLSKFPPGEEEKFKKNFETVLTVASDDKEFQANSFIGMDVAVSKGRLPRRQLQYVTELRQYINVLGAAAAIHLEEVSKDIIGVRETQRDTYQVLCAAKPKHGVRKTAFLLNRPLSPVSSVQETVELPAEWIEALGKLPETYFAGRRTDPTHVTSRFEEAKLNVPASKTCPEAISRFHVPSFYLMISRKDTWKVLLAVATYLGRDRIKEGMAPERVLGPRDFLNAFVFVSDQTGVPVAIFRELENITQQLTDMMREATREVQKLLTSARAGDAEEEEIRRMEQMLVAYALDDK